MGVIGDRLAELGLELPAPPARAARGAACRSSSCASTAALAYVSGHGPFDGDRAARSTGSVGGEVSVEQAYDAARGDRSSPCLRRSSRSSATSTV